MSWDPYLDLDSGVLRNRLGLTDPAALARAEADFTCAPFCLPQHLWTQGDLLFAQLARDDHLRGLGRDEFVDALAWLLAEINALHAFREGNGRAQRAFLAQLARVAGHPVRCAGMDPAENVAASRAAHLDGDRTRLRLLLDGVVARPGDR